MVKPMVVSHTRGRLWVWVLFVLGIVSLWALPAVAQQTYTVTTTDDNTDNDSDCTLREAILAANNDSSYNGDCGTASAADDTITFASSISGGTITLDSTLGTLPAIVDANTAGKLMIDGTGRNITISGGGRVLVMWVDSGADLTLQNLTIANGNSGGFGGGIYNGGTVTLTNSILSDNSAGDAPAGSGGGGGVFNASGGTLTIINSTLSNNSSGNIGGGVYNDGTLTIANSTFSGNSAARAGGGGVYNDGALTITNSTFSGNSAPGGGGIYNTGTVNIKNTIVANSPSGGNCFNSGTFNALGVNFDTDGSCSGFNQVTPAQLNLGSLANNGGPTQTHALLAGSVAIDAVTDCTLLDGTTPVTQDQRGVGRPQGSACDVGAYEYNLGDVNNDGKINTIDARMAQQHADGVITLTGNAFLAADVDTDSDVDSTDATAIAKKGIGLPTGIPGFATTYPLAPSLKGRGNSPPTSGEGLGERSFILALLPALVLLLRRSRKVATLLLALGVVSAVTGCVEFAGLPPPGGSAIFLTSTSMPNGATRTLEVVVQQITAQGGVAALQGQITFPAGVAIQSVTGQSGFVVKASCGTVGDPCASPNELRFSIVKPSAGGVSNGVILSLAVQARGGSGQVYTLSWSGNAQAPIVLGGETNVEITGFTTGNGQIKVQ